jgi:hypothetical protein
MNLRICDGERERILPASLRVVEQAFAPAIAIREGTEISLANQQRSLVALAIGSPADVAEGSESFLLSTISAESAVLSGPLSRREALHRFREFLLGESSEENQSGKTFR